ncbi:MAG TPA: DUF6174 domain-containing protein [Solirubrobacteraceae bacterium]|jgi:hypothetical protein|nr:DUF6174 domain-containing protein [Solirubrobacteraceae bacterium]
MSPRAAIALALLTLALAAGAPAAVAQYQGVKPDPHIADGTLQHKLDVARRSWKAAGVSSYTYRIQVSCFCPPAKDANVFVVKGGVATRFASGYRSLATVPRLFKTIQGAIDDGVANLDVSYGRRGVPTSIYIDRSQLIADEEMGYAIKAFTPSKRHAR